MREFRELKVWQVAHALFLRIHKTAQKFPAIERFVLTSQLRRAALAVPTNIVEGSKRVSQLEFARFLNIAEASLAETQYLLLVSHDLSYLDTHDYESLTSEAAEIAKMLHALRARVEQSIDPAARLQLSAFSLQPSPPR